MVHEQHGVTLLRWEFWFEVKWLTGFHCIAASGSTEGVYKQVVDTSMDLEIKHEKIQENSYITMNWKQVRLQINFHWKSIYFGAN